MRVDTGYLGWGVFFVAAGAIALAIEGGYIADQAWWSYWPLILIGAGIGLILRKTPFEGIGGLLVAATFGVMVGGSVAGGFTFGGIGDVGGGVCRIGDDGTAFADRTGSFGASATVDVELDCGTLTITTEPGSGWAVRGTNEDGDGPEVGASDAELEVDPPNGTSPSSWLIDLPTDPTLDVDLHLNAGQLRADLAGARLLALDLEVNAGQASVDLTGVSDIEGIDVGVNAGEVAITLPSHAMTGGIEANAGSVRVCAPDDVALRIETEVVLGAVDVGASGLQEVEGGWESPDYDTAPTRIELRVQANLGSVRIDPSEGCS